VFTLIMRITANRETAEELTIDVFMIVAARVALQRGDGYGARLDHEPGALAGDRPGCAREPKKRSGDVAVDGRGWCRSLRCAELREQGDGAARALAALTRMKAQAIETTFFAGLTTPKPRSG